MTGDHAVRIEPLGVDVRVSEGETVMGAAQRYGLRWPTVCEGLGECLVCRLEILEGPSGNPPLTGRERDAFTSGRLSEGKQGTVRLACQLRPAADMTVFKAGVRRPGADHKEPR